MSHNNSPLQDAIAGATAGVAAVTVSYPFDLMKTRMHFEAGKVGGAKHNIFSISRVIYSEGYNRGFMGVKPLGGYVGFYRGLDQLIPEAALKSLLRFMAFNQLQKLYKEHILGNPKAEMKLYENVVFGAIAGAIETTLVVQPFERGKTLRADMANPYKVWGDCYKTGGIGSMIRSIYTGYLPCCGRQIGNQAVSFTCFYGLKNWYLKKTGKDHISSLPSLAFGFLSGCAGASVTMPLDVAKSIAQKQTHGQSVSTIGILRDIYQRLGIRGLYTGLLPRLGRVGTDRAVLFFTFELLSSKFGMKKPH